MSACDQVFAGPDQQPRISGEGGSWLTERRADTRAVGVVASCRGEASLGKEKEARRGIPAGLGVVSKLGPGRLPPDS